MSHSPRKFRNRKTSSNNNLPVVVEPCNLEEPIPGPTIVAMADRTMEELLRAPTEGYGEAIVLPEINADHFEIKTNLLQLVQANPFHGLENENPHAHINSFKRITSTLRFRNVPNDVIKLMMFPYSIVGAALNLLPERKLGDQDKSKFLILVNLGNGDIADALARSRSFLKTDRTLIEVYEGEITLRVDNEAVTFNLDLNP
ncbi:hypothetical protein Tco_1082608 [Tanacetum coccineum]|uniref:Reverse transcriptase domain-containing protein n=1 Tax=Tanacetum coccineum TaxID=301880 RepID=A0ABQ5I151_9ASTR